MVICRLLLVLMALVVPSTSNQTIRSTSSCSVPQCLSKDNGNASSLSIKRQICYAYRISLTNEFFCGPSVDCSLFESCTIDFKCSTNTKLCLSNTCCSRPICMPVSLAAQNCDKRMDVKTTTTTTSKMPMEPTLLTSKNETIHPIWNTNIGSNSFVAVPAPSGAGTYYTTETHQNALDQNLDTKYNAKGNGTGEFDAISGLNTGFYFTLSKCPAKLIQVRVATANDYPERDPMTIAIEGSNGGDLTKGGSWTLIYNGSSGLEIDPGRYAFGRLITFSNDLVFKSLRFLSTSKRANSQSIQFSEVNFYGICDKIIEKWENSENMIIPRFSHSASVLKDGKILIAGGNNGGALHSAELYDPSTGIWSMTGKMSYARYSHTASVLKNGKVLVVGGFDDGNVLNNAELYDPLTEIWTSIGNMNNTNDFHTESVPLH